MNIVLISHSIFSLLAKKACYLLIVNKYEESQRLFLKLTKTLDNCHFSNNIHSLANELSNEIHVPMSSTSLPSLIELIRECDRDYIIRLNFIPVNDDNYKLRGFLEYYVPNVISRVNIWRTDIKGGW